MLSDNSAGAQHDVPCADDTARYAATIESGTGIQIGHGNVQHIHLPFPEPLAWPIRVGVVPLAANCLQPRALHEQGRRTDRIAVSKAAVLPIHVLSGLGGVGKTQLAGYHAESQWAAGAIDLLVWVTATSRESVLTGYADAASRIISPVATDPLRMAEQLLTWLAQTTRRWLIVLDDLQDPGDLTRLWPPTTATGQVLVTTRRRDAALARADRTISDVSVFTPGETDAYLRGVLADRPHLLKGADELARNLGYLPLALAQVAAYILDRDLTCSEYTTRLADQRTKLPELLPGPGELLPDDHRDTLAATWSLSLRLADRMAPAGLARPLMVMASLLDPNGIPAVLFTAPAVLRHFGKALGKEVTAEQARDALYVAHRLNLATVERETPDRMIRVHALVQRAIGETISESDREYAARACADALLFIWPPVERDTAFAQALRSNTDALLANAGAHLWTPRGHEVLFRAGWSLGGSGLLAAAVAYHENLVADAARYLGPDHPQTLTARYALADCRGEAGDSHAAVSALTDLLPDLIRILGPDHEDTLGVRHSLLHWRGQFEPAARTAAAEELLPDLLRVFGPQDDRVLRLRLDFARWLRRSGDLTAAAEALDSVLADQQKVLGRDHPSITKTRYNIALCRGEAGHPLGAVAALEELLADEVRVFGASRPYWQLSIRAEVARWQHEAGDTVAAVAVLEELLVDQIHFRGPDHPETCYTLRKLEAWRHQSSKQHDLEASDGGRDGD
ncbi:Kinesin light chain 2 [Amycolatopsis sp. WAC 04182]|uniref:tetratricopeptide repeat protein n=1 Tax=Amycolatopsis sp. WAC 04182 TaxID=2203198 RepID=UPI000F769F53|nr:tetratricopeptide repeat protein [Amycolatopsis sp. WAC 04182]RSN60638.1 Kinesin light chain 2 [Amycolatopsis sp. WAC 04182]